MPPRPLAPPKSLRQVSELADLRNLNCNRREKQVRVRKTKKKSAPRSLAPPGPLARLLRRPNLRISIEIKGKEQARIRKIKKNRSVINEKTKNPDPPSRPLAPPSP